VLSGVNKNKSFARVDATSLRRILAIREYKADALGDSVLDIGRGDINAISSHSVCNSI